MVPLIYFFLAFIVRSVNVAVQGPATNPTAYFSFTITVTLTNSDNSAYTSYDMITLSSNLGTISGNYYDQGGISSSSRSYSVYLTNFGSATITATLLGTGNTGTTVITVLEEKFTFSFVTTVIFS